MRDGEERRLTFQSISYQSCSMHVLPTQRNTFYFFFFFLGIHFNRRIIPQKFQQFIKCAMHFSCDLMYSRQLGEKRYSMAVVIGTV